MTAIRHRTSAGVSYRNLRRIRSVLIQHAIANGEPCELCKQPMHRGEQVHLDHRVPLAHGGTNALDNLVVVHSRCNLRKGTRTVLSGLEDTPESRLPEKRSREW